MDVNELQKWWNHFTRDKFKFNLADLDFEYVIPFFYCLINNKVTLSSEQIVVAYTASMT